MRQCSAVSHEDRHDPGMTELSKVVQDLLDDALAIAKRRGHGIVGTEHLLLAMTRQSENSVARRLLHEAGVDEDLRARVEAIIGPG
jgi:ATP-dependent Clp protease ATP-binding subunit ClpC